MSDMVATLYKNGLYWLRFQSGNGVRLLFPFRTEDEAKKWAEKKIPEYRVETKLHDGK